MMKAYQKIIETKRTDNNYIEKYSDIILAEENEIEEKEIKLTWSNLLEVYYKYGLMLPFTVWNFKKGRIIDFFEKPLKNRSIKERKTKDIPIIITERYKEIDQSTVSLDWILKYLNNQPAAQYLKERGLINIID